MKQRTPEDTDGGNIQLKILRRGAAPSDEPSDNTDSNDVTDNTEPEVGFADDFFSSGDNMTEPEQKPQDCTGKWKIQLQSLQQLLRQRMQKSIQPLCFIHVGSWKREISG